MSSPPEQRRGIVRILVRVALNIGLVRFLQSFFPIFFVLQGGLKALVFVGLILTLVNWFIVPLLSLLSFPIKLFAWIVAFFLVNSIALWMVSTFVNSLAVPGLSLTIGGGIVGWLVLSAVLGFCNWIVKAFMR